ncbi:ATP-grasp domain-containing protein [Rhodococcus sp. SBT000017]|uniref:ATP-grasp domain-containing protein n=1 Tax=unclassified Rhodococcus (in: high G+C Gram-positive bacteria) TaxID=192944 RepID=UPI000AF23229|nr:MULTISPECIES: ATP-grasp domain-containing protein [unclassified Rhodococcus (in: high G+C Gram-positive bacteria)]RMB71748.1 ATP-grasp domain-containing protein [Rhodococcus sp. SBT000017]
MEAARERGVDIHFVVEKVKADLAGSAYTLVSDLSDIAEVVRAVAASGNLVPTAAVTGHEQAVLPVAALRGLHGLPGNRDLATYLRFRDKYLQKAALPPTIAHAQCRYVKRADTEFAAMAAQMGSSLVLKPADGHGSNNTALVDSQQSYDRYFAESPILSDVGTVAESYVSGREIHVDGVWVDGRIEWSAVSAYLDQLMNWAMGGVVGDYPIDSSDSSLTRLAEAFATQVLTALGAPDTVFHLEAFVDSDGTLTLGEVAARMVGAMTPEILARTYGVDLYGASLDLALGRAPVLPKSRKAPDTLFGFVFLNRHPGARVSEADIRARFDVADCSFPESRIGDSTRSYGRWGHAILGRASVSALEADLRSVAEFTKTG